MARTKRNTRRVEPAGVQQTNLPLSAEMRELLDQLEQQRETLELRLRKGEELIAAARSRGEEVARWESQWIGLLNEYEQVSLQIELVLESARPAACSPAA